MTQLELEQLGDRFDYICHLCNWLEFEKVCKLHYSQMEQLTMAMDEMDKYTVYNKVLNLLYIFSTTSVIYIIGWNLRRFVNSIILKWNNIQWLWMIWINTLFTIRH